MLFKNNLILLKSRYLKNIYLKNNQFSITDLRDCSLEIGAEGEVISISMICTTTAACIFSFYRLLSVSQAEQLE